MQSQQVRAARASKVKGGFEVPQESSQLGKSIMQNITLLI